MLPRPDLLIYAQMNDLTNKNIVNQANVLDFLEAAVSI